jgi:protein TonB
MNKFLFLLIFFFAFQIVSAQEQPIIPDEKVYDIKYVDEKPDYSEGIKAFYSFVAKNFKTPEKEGLNGKIITTFIVEIDGNISDIRVLQDIGFGTGAEVLNVLKRSKKWIPAKLNGNPVRSLFQFPITIKSVEKYSRKSQQ